MLNLKLKRIYKGPLYTIGHLYINDKYFCDTLEDTDRGLKSTDSLISLKATKIKSKTAIPTGKYKVTLKVQSPRFSSKSQYTFCKGYLPRLIDVPAYEGVLIHIGNKPKDTDGCILVGLNKVKGQVINSTDTFKKLYTELNKHKDEEIYITIE